MHLYPTFTNTCDNHLSFVFINRDNAHLPDDKKRIIEAHATAKGLPIPVDPPPAPAPVVSHAAPPIVAPVDGGSAVVAPVLAAPESLPAPEAAAVELPPPEPEQHTVSPRLYCFIVLYNCANEVLTIAF